MTGLSFVWELRLRPRSGSCGKGQRGAGRRTRRQKKGCAWWRQGNADGFWMQRVVSGWMIWRYGLTTVRERVNLVSVSIPGCVCSGIQHFLFQIDARIVGGQSAGSGQTICRVRKNPAEVLDSILTIVCLLASNARRRCASVCALRVSAMHVGRRRAGAG